MSCAYLLVSHGSRDPRPEIAVQQLLGLIREQAKEGIFDSACLELQPEPLHQQIKKFAVTALAAGCDRLQVIPLFLAPGVHAMKDIPDEIALAQQALGENMIVDLQPYIGTHPNLKSLLAKQISPKNTASWIILAHGSRRPSSQAQVEAMAENLGAMVAYWSIAPSLEAKVKDLIAVGKREIAILPYFLFPGSITDAIAQSIDQLKLQFPLVNFYLAPPLGANTQELAQLIWDSINT
ncbi:MULTISPECIES: sirohydrochlorin chelatase [Calothrix]|uniref:Sirohydrochlorin chelatase n=2 Tax=Calothrix TaxID=1186 RepID=A0ABR8AA59_9CYAN|nr:MULTISPECIES: sirohydrochlorin chelatase [Calothrix]MBD2196783.1 sirohydrochlorin chelatase [Calothrix parietina FACHB-288]MBD2225335.1 sirohydrochlorin chelatase [Calothrix anomala FACHB-343]